MSHAIPALSSQVLPDASDPLHVRTQSNNPPTCGDGYAQDFFGLGVRLGIYFAWLTSYVANVFLSDEIAGALDTNAIFLFTLLVAMVRQTVTGKLTQLDALILMQLSAGTLFGVLSVWGYRCCQYQQEGPRGIRHFGGFGTHLRLLLSTAVSVYGLWFWISGIKGGLDTNLRHLDNCENLYTFMFAKVHARGGIRYFYIVICVLCTAYFGAMLLVSTLAGYSRLIKMFILTKNRQWATTSRLRYATGLEISELHFLYKGLRVLNLLWLIFSACMVEFTLNFNNLVFVLGGHGHIGSPSQLLPALLGAFGFVRILWIWFEEWRSPGDTDPSVVSPSSEKPRRSRTLRAGLGILQVFSPAMSRSEVETVIERDIDKIDPLMVNQPAWYRYLVTWLPWLSLWRHSGHGGNGLPTREDEYDKDRQQSTPPLLQVTTAVEDGSNRRESDRTTPSEPRR